MTETVVCPYCADAHAGHTYYNKCPLCFSLNKVSPEIASLFRMIPNGPANDVDAVMPSTTATIEEARIWECAIQAGDVKVWQATVAWVIVSRSNVRHNLKMQNELYRRVARRYLRQCNYCYGSGVAYVASDGSTGECKPCDGWGALHVVAGW